MKRTLLLILTAALLCCCTRKPVVPRFGEVTADTLLGSADAGYRISYRFATIENADRDASLAAIERSNISYFFGTESAEGGAAEAVARSLEELAGELPPAESVVDCYTLTVESEAAVVDTLLTYAITRSSYTGGAHGMFTVEYHTYALDGGYEVTLADLFSEAQRERLRAALKLKLYAAYGVATDEELGERGFFPALIDLTENFTLTTDSLIFRYNPYDIASYATGPVEVSFARGEWGAE